MSELQDNLLEGRILEEVYKAIRHWFEHPSEDPSRITFEDLLSVYVTAWATPKCNPHGAKVNLDAELEGLGLPSRRTPGHTMVRAARKLKPPAELWIKNSEKGRWINPDIMAQVQVLEDEANEVLMEITNQVILDLNWVQSDLIATIDGHGVPFRGRGSMLLNVTDEYAERLGENFHHSKPGVRNKKTKVGDTIAKSSVPENKGTWRKHEWFHLTLHNYHTRESFPIAVLYRVGTKAQEMQRAAEILKKLVVPPKCILLDREFSNAYQCLFELRQFADRRDVYIFGPMKAETTHTDKAKKLWRAKKWQLVLNHKSPLAYVSGAYVTKNDPSGGHHIGYYYRPVKPGRSGFLEDWQKDTVMTGPHAKKSIQAFMLYSNKPVSLEDASWALHAYSRRWACETYFQVYAENIGRSQSPSFGVRNLGYLGGHVLLALHGAWRAYKVHNATMDALDSEVDEKAAEVEMRRFLGHIRGQVRRQFLSLE